MEQKSIKVSIIGSGNVAEHLALAFAEAKGVELVEVCGRNADRVAAISQMAECNSSNDFAALREADIYIVSVTDRYVGEVAAMLKVPTNSIIAHTAGCVPMQVLPETARRGVFYPFQTFSMGHRLDISRVPLFIEGDNAQTHEELRALAHAISNVVRDADSELRRKVHLSGVFASNYVNRMYTYALRNIEEAGLGFECIAPVIEETARKCLERQNPALLQTGPARRGDRATIERHLQQLEHNPEVREIYRLLCEDIMREWCSEA